MSTKLDLFAVLGRLDRGDMDLYQSLGEDQRVELEKILGFLLPKWMTGIHNDQAHMIALTTFNEHGNRGWHDKLSGHPELQTKILATCGSGRTQRHKFYKSGKRYQGSPLHDLLCIDIPDARIEDCVRWVRNTEEDDVVELCHFNGYQDDQTDAVVEEYRMIKKRM